jgi:hypothetical protein
VQQKPAPENLDLQGIADSMEGQHVRKENTEKEQQSDDFATRNYPPNGDSGSFSYIHRARLS